MYLKINKYHIPQKKTKFEELIRFKTVYKNLADFFPIANEHFIKNESQKHDALFSDIDGKSLDEQQRRAVITDEDRVLVLAGAGSGKTLTISAKVKYLCHVKNIIPKDILLISFTRKSAQEMTERIQDKLGIPCEATTFHKLGLDIIKNATATRPDVLDENSLNKFMHNFFENEIENHPELIKNLTEYFIYFLEIPNNLENYSSLGALYEDEKLYPFESDDPLRKAYRPDFYLTDYDIYLEHFDITKNFTAPWLSPIEEKKYLDGIEWKRAVHKKNKTKLLETYSYYSSDGILLKKLTEKILSGHTINSYKYVIVDEYQDISKSRFNLLKAIADKTGAKFFCVGDDWQSIYRFAGSDISLFTDFAKHFGYTKILKIEKTYRNSQQLINEASNFITQNPLQLKKDLCSDKSLDYPLVFWGFDENPKQVLLFIINKIISDFGINTSILLLGRTQYDIEILKDTGLFKTTYKNRKEIMQYIPIPELQINFLSVHKSKGLEADNVIILNFKNDKLGFPNQISDDKILNLVLTDTEDFKFAEERRLFYVAMTRTKNRTFVLTDNKNPSPFFKEFSESNSVCFISIKNDEKDAQTKCPVCKTGNLLKVVHNEKVL